MPANAKSDLVVEFALLGLLALLWGLSYLFIKVAVAEIPPIPLIAIRVSVAAAILCIVQGLRRQKLPRDRKAWTMLLVQSFFNSIGAWTVLAGLRRYLVLLRSTCQPGKLSWYSSLLLRELPLAPTENPVNGIAVKGAE